MKLRLRLFLSIACLFSLIFLCAFLYQDYLIQKNLSKNKQEFISQIEKVNREKIKKIEAYIADVLSEYKNNINALLTIIRNFPVLRYNFEADPEKIHNKTWLDSSTIITNNKWLDFVQNIKQGENASTISLINKTLPPLRIYSLSEHTHIVFVEQSKAPSKVLIAAKWKNPNFLNQERKDSIYKLPEESFADFYVLFKKETIEAMDFEKMQIKDLILTINPLYPFLKWVEVKEKTQMLTGLIEELKIIQQELASFNAFFANPSLEAFQLDPMQLQENLSISFNRELDEHINRYHQIGMIWGLSTLIASGPFGQVPQSSQAPLGIIRAKKDFTLGEVLWSKDVFFKAEQFQRRALKPVKQFQNEIEVIFLKEDRGRCFFGNTAFLFKDNISSELTLGVNANKVFKEIALATNRDVLFLADKNVISFFDAKGITKPTSGISQEMIDLLISQDLGVFSLDGVEYFFLHMQPFPGKDFHFFAITTSAHEFFLINKENKQISTIVKKINLEMSLIALISFFLLLVFLDIAATRITKPISLLAAAANSVKEGDYEAAYHPPKQEIQGDEVKALYASFYDMVKGLKEKEKVRSILNKVVSTDIANEILKKDLNLGGEEKEVTVFFSDIRRFTAISEKMSPKDTIDMLNECMTYVTQPIEKHHGVIDKYVGDEVMAIFGAPIEMENSEYEAILSAIAINKVLLDWNVQRAQQGKEKIEMGFGINKGKVIVGNMGAANRLNYTVIGSNVNLTARMCAFAKPSEILISEGVAKNSLVKNNILIEELEPIEFKGFSQKVRIFKVLGIKP